VVLKLHVIAGLEQCQSMTCLREVLEAGVDVVQLRDFTKTHREMYTLCQALSLALPSLEKISLNDHADVALAMRTGGIQVGRRSLPVDVVQSMGRAMHWRGEVGCSVHSLEEAQNAEQLGADYVTFGHIYDSQSHLGEAPRGVEALARVVEAVRIPVIAIGGITQANMHNVLATGCAGIAVIGAVWASPHPLDAVKKIKGLLNAWTSA
jgi:thiamine-phosphate diphosphorylase